jgi:hypothetical protein
VAKAKSQRPESPCAPYTLTGSQSTPQQQPLASLRAAEPNLRLAHFFNGKFESLASY